MNRPEHIQTVVLKTLWQWCCWNKYIIFWGSCYELTRNYDKAKSTPKSVFILWQATKMSIGYIKTLLRPGILKGDEWEVIT